MEETRDTTVVGCDMPYKRTAFVELTLQRRKGKTGESKVLTWHGLPLAK